jgi:3,4-dihydroxy 2-butanone 4-phosphate synthase / GTP cyclohydrolase II
VSFAPVETAITALAGGAPVVVVDAADRENEGDIILPAEMATPERIAFMVRYTSGLVCVALEGTRLDTLALPLMVPDNTEAHRTAFTVSVDAMRGTTTGISAADRAATIHALVDAATRPEDLARPGHVFPLRARAGGVLARPGHTEAAVDLTRLAGLQPAGVLAEVVNDDGSMARLPELQSFAATHGLALISIADLIRYRQEREQTVEHVASARLPTRHGHVTAHVYRSVQGAEHLALVCGPPEGDEPVLVRLHSECLTGDVFGSLRCDCGTQLEQALSRIVQQGRGVVVYLRGHAGRGIGLGQTVRADTLRDGGCDTLDANLALGLPAEAREYATAARILLDLEIKQVHLLTNNPAEVLALQAGGVEVVERVPLLTVPSDDNVRYLRAKQDRLDHLLGLG